jgi:cell division protein FtsI (penicillin-binding protein 3)
MEKYHLYLDPESIPLKRKREIAAILKRYLDLSNEESHGLLTQLHKKSRSRKVALWLDADLKDAISEWWRPYARKYKIPRNALYFAADYQRSYPFGKLLGQVLHTVQHTRDEKTLQSIPTGGLELQFHRFLKGKGGKRRLMRSPRNALEMGEVIVKPENGADIHLTIHHALQAIAEEELERGVRKCKAKAGWAVMMDPFTGEIWACAQYPFFYPSDYQRYFNDPLLIEHTKVKAVTDANEPGSVMKPITCAIAFMANEELKKQGKEPLFTPEEKIPTASGKFPGRTKPITDTHFHRPLSQHGYGYPALFQYLCCQISGEDH